MTQNDVDAEIILMDDLIDGAAKLLRDANRWRKLEMLIDSMITHEHRWFVYPSPFDEYLMSIDALREAIDKIDCIIPS